MLSCSLNLRSIVQRLYPCNGLILHVKEKFNYFISFVCHLHHRLPLQIFSAVNCKGWFITHCFKPSARLATAMYLDFRYRTRPAMPFALQICFGVCVQRQKAQIDVREQDLVKLFGQLWSYRIHQNLASRYPSVWVSSPHYLKSDKLVASPFWNNLFRIITPSVQSLHCCEARVLSLLP